MNTTLTFPLWIIPAFLTVICIYQGFFKERQDMDVIISFFWALAIIPIWLGFFTILFFLK